VRTLDPGVDAGERLNYMLADSALVAAAHAGVACGNVQYTVQRCRCWIFENCFSMSVNQPLIWKRIGTGVTPETPRLCDLHSGAACRPTGVHD